MSEVIEISNALVVHLQHLQHVLTQSRSCTDLASDVPPYVADERDTTTFPLRLAFVGQYNAGKTTLINALTGLDLPTGAGVVTDSVEEHGWKGVWLVDTPGVQTGTREGHDEKSRETCLNCDLIVFVTTTQLLDPAAHDLLHELAGPMRKAHQMMVVINKATQDTAPPSNVVEAAEQEIQPHRLPVVLCDAKAYVDASHEDDDELRRELLTAANLDHVSQELTRLARESGLLGRLSTPAQRAVLVCDRALEVSHAEARQAEAAAADLDAARTELGRAHSLLDEDTNRITQELSREVAELADEPCSILEEGVDSESAKRLNELIRMADESIIEYQVRAVDELESAITRANAMVEARYQAVYDGGATAELIREGVTRAQVDYTIEGSPLDRLFGELTGDLVETIRTEATDAIHFKVPTGTRPGEPLHGLVHAFKRKLHGSDIKPWSIVNSARQIEPIAKFLNKFDGVGGKAARGVADLALDEALRVFDAYRRSSQAQELRQCHESAAEAASKQVAELVKPVLNQLEQQENELARLAAEQAEIAQMERATAAELVGLRDAFVALHDRSQQL